MIVLPTLSELVIVLVELVVVVVEVDVALLELSSAANAPLTGRRTDAPRAARVRIFRLDMELLLVGCLDSGRAAEGSGQAPVSEKSAGPGSPA